MEEPETEPEVLLLLSTMMDLRYLHGALPAAALSYCTTQLSISLSLSSQTAGARDGAGGAFGDGGARDRVGGPSSAVDADGPQVLLYRGALPAALDTLYFYSIYSSLPCSLSLSLSSQTLRRAGAGPGGAGTGADANSGRGAVDVSTAQV